MFRNLAKKLKSKKKNTPQASISITQLQATVYDRPVNFETALEYYKRLFKQKSQDLEHKAATLTQPEGKERKSLEGSAPENDKLVKEKRAKKLQLDELVKAISAYQDRDKDQWSTQRALQDLLAKLTKVDVKDFIATDKFFSRLKAKTWGTGTYNEHAALVALCQKRLEVFQQLEELCSQLRPLQAKINGKLGKAAEERQQEYTEKSTLLGQVADAFEKGNLHNETALQNFKITVDIKANKACVKGKGEVATLIQNLSRALQEEVSQYEPANEEHLAKPEPRKPGPQFYEEL